MNRFLVGLTVVVAAGSMTWAQPDKPIHPATPAFAPVASQPDKAKEKAEQPKLYDEQADAKQQIAAAVAKAKKENRRVLVQWGFNKCGWCVKLHELYGKDADIRKKLLYEYDVVYVDVGAGFDKHMDVAKSYGANFKGVPYLTVLDSDGKPIANQDTEALELKDKSFGHDPKAVLDFLSKYQATYLDAQKVLDAGLAEAKKSGKRVFLHFGAPWCGYCHKLENWMARPEIAVVLAKEFVDLKIDVDRMTDGNQVMAKYRTRKDGGIPWFVFLDSDGKALTDSYGPKGNTGYPEKPEEVEHFGDMLKKAAAKLTPAEIDMLTGTLKKKAVAEKDGH